MDTDMMLLALVCGAVWGLVRVTIALMDRSAERELLALQFELDEIMAGGPSGAEPARPHSARPAVAARRSAGAASRARLQGAF